MRATGPRLVTRRTSVVDLALSGYRRAASRPTTATNATYAAKWVCWLVRYRASDLGRVPHGTTNGVVSRRHGLESVYATTRMFTPEGIGIGSNLGQVRLAYSRPDLQPGDFVTFHVSAGIVYRIQLSRKVTSLALQYQRLDCHR